MKEENIINQELTNKSLYISLIFLALIIITTISLFFYNTYLTKNIADNETKIITYEKSINDLKKDNKIVIYKLVEKNKSILEKMRVYSEITRFIEELDYIQNTYQITLNGFNYSNGTLGTSVLVSSKFKEAYEKTIDFFTGYRNNKKALFNLSFVDNFSGETTMGFNINLTLKEDIKPTTSKKIETVIITNGPTIENVKN